VPGAHGVVAPTCSRRITAPVNVFELIADRLIVGKQQRHSCGPERLRLGRGGGCWAERDQLLGLLPIAVEPALVFGAEDEDVDLGLSEGSYTAGVKMLAISGPIVPELAVSVLVLQ
jgi:hypothetical protein